MWLSQPEPQRDSKGQHLQTQQQGKDSQEPPLLPGKEGWLRAIQHCQQDTDFSISSVCSHCIHPELLMPLQHSWRGRLALLLQEGGSIPGCAQFTGQTPEGSFWLDPRRCCRAKQSERRLGSKPTLQHKTSINSTGIWPLHKSVGSSCTTLTTMSAA